MLFSTTILVSFAIHSNLKVVVQVCAPLGNRNIKIEHKNVHNTVKQRNIIDDLN